MPNHIDFAARDGGIYLNQPLRRYPEPFSLKGLSWFGAEGNGAVPDGLWQRPAGKMLDYVRSLHFNAVRLPLAVDNVLKNPEINKWSLTANEELRGLRSLQVRNIHVHLCTTGAATGLGT